MITDDAPHIPWWAKLLARYPSRMHCAFDWLTMLGFWEMPDGDYYVNGHWNWRCWETWERSGALLPDQWGDEARNWMPWFPRQMKRLFG